MEVSKALQIYGVTFFRSIEVQFSRTTVARVDCYLFLKILSSMAHQLARLRRPATITRWHQSLEIQKHVKRWNFRGGTYELKCKVTDVSVSKNVSIIEALDRWSVSNEISNEIDAGFLPHNIPWMTTYWWTIISLTSFKTASDELLTIDIWQPSSNRQGEFELS